MAELYPYPFDALVKRMFGELEARGSIFDLPARSFFTGDTGHDYSRKFHGLAASSPFGPAAGPQSQLAQNIVLSWLGGGRIMELKTVQIMDELEIPRPCIDMETIGFNVEWSQELKLQQSLEEYVKAVMLIEMLKKSGKIDLAPGFGDTLYDMSVGYDLKGIQSEPVQDFIKGMLDASSLVEKFRAEIPAEHAAFKDLEYPTRLSNTLTLSTFHGCPPEEIESIIDWLLKEIGLHCIVKLNPTLLGPEVARGIMRDELGYKSIDIPDSAFESDTSWQQAVDFTGRLGATAKGLGLGFGVKFSNTLIVKNYRDFFPENEDVMYASGRPLHVLAMNLVKKFRSTFGDEYPISFSAGIDRGNFPDAVALGLTPITVCSDLLKPGGYARAAGYFKDLTKRMDAVGATDTEEFIIRAYGKGQEALERLAFKNPAPDDAAKIAACKAGLSENGDLRAAAGDELFAGWVSEASLLNTEFYVPGLVADPRYHFDQNSKPPKKIGSTLELFDCITCDKCVPVCPNNANFTYDVPATTVPVRRMNHGDDGWVTSTHGEVVIAEKHQIANYADFCNECGNCDIFCPEDGGPYILKPRFFGSLETWTLHSTHDGFFMSHEDGKAVIHGRIEGKDFRVEEAGSAGSHRYEGPGFIVVRDASGQESVEQADPGTEIDLTYLDLMLLLQRSVVTPEAMSVVSVLATE